MRDDNGRDVALGERGEICIKGPQVMAGYWERPDETAKVIDKNGWLATGDIGVMDELGFVRIVDRKKDMILVSGFNVYPNEIEAVVAMHPGVLECAAIGVPDAKSGEAVKLFVVKKDPALTAEVAAGALSRTAHRATSVRARSNFGPSCRNRTSARSCAANCATRPRRRRHERDGPPQRDHRSAQSRRTPMTMATPVEQQANLPDPQPALRVVPMPADANQHGDIFGGWVMSQVDIAGAVPAARRARGRVATVAVNSFVFKQPVLVGDVVSFYAELTRTGRTSITVDVQVYAQRNPGRAHLRQGDRGESHLCCSRAGPASQGPATGVTPAYAPVYSCQRHPCTARRLSERRDNRSNSSCLSTEGGRIT